jgi:hypothetical protein
MNLYLALVWLILGIAVLAWQASFPKAGFYLPVGDSQISYGWFMLVLVVYNLLRWWNVRTQQLERRADRLQTAADKRKNSTRQETPDPNFNFTDEPGPIRRSDGSEHSAPPG